jgi:AsmA protein
MCLYAVTCLLVAASVALASVVVYVRHNSAAIVGEYVDALARRTGFSVRLQRVEAVFWPAPMLIVGGLALENAQWNFSAEEIRLRPDLAGILQGAFMPAALELKRPVLRISRPVVPGAGMDALLAFASGHGGKEKKLKGVRLTINNGQALFVEKGAVSPLLSSLDLTVDVHEGRGGRRRCEIGTGGDLYKDGVALPFSLGGEVYAYGPDGVAPDRVAVKDFALRLDNDSALLDAVLTLPGGQSAASLSPEETFNLKGGLRVRRVSLTRWLGFGRILSPGLQWALDNVTDAVLDFSLNNRGLDVPSIAAVAGGARFTGSGGVRSWAEPEVALDLKTQRLDLAVPIPEAAGRLPLAPAFAHGPLTPVPGEPLKPGETGLAYDIRLGARLLDYGPLLLEEARVVIGQGRLDENGLEDTLLTAEAGLYGGSVRAQAIFGGGQGNPYAISAHLRDVGGDGLARALDVVPVQSGRMRADVDVKSQGRALAEFLEKLTGKVEVGVSRGALRGLPSKKDKGKSTSEKNSGTSRTLPFETLALKLDLKSAVFEEEKSRLGLNGQWSSLLNRAEGSLRADIAGMMYFGQEDALFFQNRPGSLVLQSGSAEGRDSRAELKGVFSCMSGQGRISVGGGQLSLPGLEAEGDIYFFEEGESLAYKGTISARSRDAARLAALAGTERARLLHKAPAFSLTAEARGNMREISLDKLRAVVDDIPLRGSLSASFREQPSFEFELTVEELSLKRFFQGSGPGANKADKPDKPWDLRSLREVRAKGLLRVGRLDVWHFALRDVSIPIRLDKGRLTADSISARVYGGVFSGKSVLEFTRSLHVESAFSIEGADLAAASPDIDAGALFGGKAGFALHLSGLLTGVGPVPKALNGSWRFAARHGSYQKLDKNGEARGKPTLFDTARASGGISAGVARSSDFILQGDGLVMHGGGLADFNTDTLDCNVLVNMKNLPEIPVRLHGNFKDSKTTVSVGTVILNTLGAIPKGIFDILGDIVGGGWKQSR